MKVITIKEPYATLIAEGYKKYEFRSWKTNYRGEIYIHAGKSVDREAMKRFEYLNLKCSCGEIIAKVNITDCIKVDDDFIKKVYPHDKNVYKNLESKQNPNGHKYAFKLENATKINSIKVNGKLGIWNY